MMLTCGSGSVVILPLYLLQLLMANCVVNACAVSTRSSSRAFFRSLGNFIAAIFVRFSTERSVVATLVLVPVCVGKLDLPFSFCNC